VWWRQEYAGERHRNSEKAGEGDRMSKTKTKPFDPAEYLDDSNAVAAYMSEALESGAGARDE
jgi:hypothetical protein